MIYNVIKIDQINANIHKTRLVLKIYHVVFLENKYIILIFQLLIIKLSNLCCHQIQLIIVAYH